MVRTKQNYEFDESVGIWRRKDRSGEISYSDGDEVEEETLEIIRSATDRSSGSDELSLPRMRWPLEYHLSASRENLLVPFEFKDLDVLEIGSGCGALTRFLGEAGTRTVTAVEGSPRRAQITAVRCQDLPNVAVFCDNFDRFESERSFDIVLAIGVLEYAPAYFGGTDPVNSFLARVGAFLKDSGSLIIAIENQLGLKYFSGCSEDHAGRMFYGIENLYDAGAGFVTFGRQELIERIVCAGFPFTKFFYPFPDYKLPYAVFTETGMQDRQFESGRIISEFVARDYSRPRDNYFSEQAAWPVMTRNQLGEHLSNSFLVFASRREPSSLAMNADWLVKLFNGHRRKRFRTVTTLRRTDGVIEVQKDRLHSEIPHESPEIVEMLVPQKNVYVSGETMAHSLTKSLAQQQITISDFVKDLTPWYGFLRENLVQERGTGSVGTLPGRFLDCVPRNLIPCPNVYPGLVYFDAEWNYLEPLPIELVLFRGLLHFRVQDALGPEFTQVPLRKIMGRVFSGLGLSLSDADLHRLVEAEADFQSLITTWDRQMWVQETLAVLDRPFRARDTLGSIADERNEFQLRLAESQQEIHRIQQEIHRIENSLSWKLTAPLRRGRDLIQRLRGHFFRM